jgi:hypothetical protein
LSEREREVSARHGVLEAAKPLQVAACAAADELAWPLAITLGGRLAHGFARMGAIDHAIVQAVEPAHTRGV